MDEDGFHAKPTPGFDIGKRVADDYAVLRIDRWKIFHCLLEEAGIGLAAMACASLMRAVVDRVQARTVQREVAAHEMVNMFKLVDGEEPQGDCALVAHHDHCQSGAIHTGDRLHGPGYPLELRPVAYISALRQLTVQHSIAIEKNMTHYNYQG